MHAQAAPPEHYAWIAERSGCAITSVFRAIEAVDSTEAIRGMVGFEGFTANAAQCHMAADTPHAWRTLLPAAAEYAFGQLGLGLLLAMVPAGRLRSLRFAKHVGFRETYRVKDGERVGEDLVFLELRRDEYRNPLPEED